MESRNRQRIYHRSSVHRFPKGFRYSFARRPFIQVTGMRNLWRSTQIYNELPLRQKAVYGGEQPEIIN